MSHGPLPAVIFRAYDIRGIVGQELTEDTVFKIGRAIGSEACRQKIQRIVVGRDGRASGIPLLSALGQGLQSTGLEVVDVGCIPTPTLYFAAHHLAAGSGVMVTGSHNPAEYNGLKIMLAGDTLCGDAIQLLYQRIVSGDYHQGQGRLTHAGIIDTYLQELAGNIQLTRPFKVVVDCGNGVAGLVAPQLLKALGCEVNELFCELDSNFPNHHPDPSQPENLQDLIQTVKQQKADIGLAFDGDGDRLGLVTAKGHIVWPDRLMMLFAQDVLSHHPGTRIIYDIKCSAKLKQVIEAAGGQAVMMCSGHSLIKAQMKQTGALLGGELSGHLFFAERWYGFDDALYAAARLLEILAKRDCSPQEVFDALPDAINTPELRVAMAEGEPARFIQQLLMHTDVFEGARLTSIDGLRVDYPDAWGLIRASNTTPSLVLRFEADSHEALDKIQTRFRKLILLLAPGLTLPF